MQDLVISLHRAPGDTVVLTGLLRDLQAARPGEYRVWADVDQPALLRHNPHVHAAGRWKGRAWPAGTLQVHAEYGRGIVQQKYEPVHFLAWFHRDFGAKTGVAVPVTRPVPDLHLAGAELEPPVAGRYWVFVAGGKSDATVKIWSRSEWQHAADLVRGLGLGVVQVGARGRGHIHLPLDGTLDLVGRTSLRDVLRLIRHADGVVCGVTFAMHAAAALGREAWWWEAYVNQNKGFGPASGAVPVPHKYLHTIGLLPCGHGKHGCWRNSVVPPDGKGLICHYPAAAGGQAVPLCMTLITGNHVAEAVMEYYEDGTLPPVSRAGNLPALPPAGRAVLVRALEGVDPLPPARPASPLPPPPLPDPAYDDPAIGGRLTAFVLLYGDYPEMHRRCLDALVATTPRDRLEIRVISNQLCAATGRHVAALVAAGAVAHHRANPGNPGKYPAMRAAFRDAALPIATDYLLWLDDDTICDRDPHWLRRLVALIARDHPGGARMFGPAAHIGLVPGQADWIKAAPWYRGRPFRDKHGRETPLGNRVHFVTGSFWALHVPTMRECDIPDPRLQHNGGDVIIGEQLHQMGHRFAAFSNGKDLVNWSGTPRRGRSEKPAGAR
jgi:hypothetical protein